MNIFDYAKETGYKVTRQFRGPLDALDKPPFRVSLQSANGIGKTRVLAHAACHYLEKGNYQIYCVGKTEGHCRITLMREIVSAARERENLKPFIARSRHKIEISDATFCKILTQEAIESIQGLHGGNVIFLVDEATGVKPEIFDAILSNLTGSNNSIVVAFNPINSGAYVKQLTQQDGWTTFKLSALDHENVLSGTNTIDGAVTRKSVIEFADRFSEQCDSNYPRAVYIGFAERYYKPTPGLLARVLGEWATQSEGGLFDTSLIKRSSFLEPPTASVIGVDVNRRSVMVSEWVDGSCTRIRDFTGMNLSYLSTRLCDEYADALICVDDNGVGGGLTDILHQLGKNVRPVNVTKSAVGIWEGTARPMNLRTELYLDLDRALRAQEVSLPVDVQLDEELLAVEIVAAKNQQGSCKVKDKTEMMKQLGRSPDRADAVILGYYGVCSDARENFSLLNFYNYGSHKISFGQQSILGIPEVLSKAA